MVTSGCSCFFEKFLVTDQFYNFKPWLRVRKTKTTQLFNKMFNILLQ